MLYVYYYFNKVQKYTNLPKKSAWYGKVTYTKRPKKLGSGDTVNLADIVIKRSCLSPTSVPYHLQRKQNDQQSDFFTSKKEAKEFLLSTLTTPQAQKRRNRKRFFLKDSEKH